MNKQILFFGLILFLSLSLYAERNDINGREIVDTGKIFEVEGVLNEVDGEWNLSNGIKEYALHLGNEEYIEKLSMNLESGKNAKVVGFIVNEDLAVNTIMVNDKTFVLRDENGRPAWAGNGRRRNASNREDKLEHHNHD